MPLEFQYSSIQNLELWSAVRNGFSFVIGQESPAGMGFHGLPGYTATWRSLDDPNQRTIRIEGSPFKTFTDAEKVCNEILRQLTHDRL